MYAFESHFPEAQWCHLCANCLYLQLQCQKQMAAFSMLDTTVGQRSSTQTSFQFMQKVSDNYGHQTCWPKKMLPIEVF